MKSSPASEMRDLDRRAVEEYGVPGFTLMLNAGKAVADEAEKAAVSAGIRRFVILAGKGNNGGDAFVAAQILFQKGCEVELFFTHTPEELKGDALKAWYFLDAELKQQVRHTLAAIDLKKRCMVIDGLLGTGVTGTPRGKAAEWITLVSESKRPVLAVDIPSGMSAGDGSAELALAADITVTMARPKTGMVCGKGPVLCGRIIVADIGFPEAALADVKGEKELFTLSDAEKLLRRESFDTFKNRRGHLFVYGGSLLYPSAPFLTGEAALRAGAGLVTVAVPENTNIFCSVPKALIVRRFGTANPTAATAVAAGPGLTCSLSLCSLLETLLASGKSMVLDADALNLVSLYPELLKKRKGDAILTPHPGEMSRLMKAFSVPEGAREETALSLARKTGCFVLLKGCRTVTASPEGAVSINLSGSPALATAGSGDVLTGVTGAFLARGYTPWDAMRLGAFIHGLAGESLAPLSRFGTGVIADDLPSAVGKCLREL